MQPRFLASVYRKVLETSETITEIQLLWTGIATIAIIALLGCMTLVKRVIGQKSKQEIIKNMQETLIMETQDMDFASLEK